MSEVDVKRLEEIDQYWYIRKEMIAESAGMKQAFIDDIDYVFEQAGRVRGLEELLQGNDGMSVKEIRSQFINLHRNSLDIEKENERLRAAIKLSLEKHKWNNEESAQILEQALGVSE